MHPRPSPPPRSVALHFILFVAFGFTVAATGWAGAGNAAAVPHFPNPMYPVGQDPVSVASGDFNGDGIPDLAVANSGSGDVSILLGRGGGDFQPERRVSLGVSPNSITAGDFDRDGTTDLAVTNPADRVIILKGLGDGNFAIQGSYSTGRTPIFVAAADLNRDGVPDLAVANVASDDVSVLLGLGDGSFHSEMRFPAGGGAYSLVVTDFNMDGSPDLAVATAYDATGVAVLTGRGDGRFDSPVTFVPAGPGDVSIDAGDFDGDGRPDLVVGNTYSGLVAVLLGNGAGGIHALFQVNFGAGMGIDWVVALDFNGDGIQDLAVMNGSIQLLAGHGDGTFGPPELIIAPASMGIVTDLDSDGSPDLAVVRKSTHSNYVAAVMSAGHGALGPRSLPGGDGATMVTTGDFSADGLPDLAAGFFGSGEVGAFLGHGNGEFAPQARVPFGNPFPGPLGGQLRAISAGDFGGDGRLDLAVTTSYPNVAASVLTGTGDGGFLAPGKPPRSFTADIDKPLAGEFSGDGRQDLACTTSSLGNLKILLGRSDGSFDVLLGSDPAVPLGSLALGDFDGNGTQDLAATTFAGTTSVAFLPGHGDGTFGFTGSFGVGDFSQNMAAGDFNEDGRLDLAVAHGLFAINDLGPPPGDLSALDKVSVLLGEGNGNFGPETRFQSGQADFLAAADFNGDGHLDLVVSDPWSCSYSILPGNGDGSFEAPRMFAGCGDFAVADFNGDGRADLAFASGGLWVALNQGAAANRPPVADAGPDVRMECASPAGAEVLLDGSRSSDPDSAPGAQSDIAAFDWFEDYGRSSQRLLGSGETLDRVLPLGEHRITLRVTDRAGASATDEAAVTVADTVAPRISLQLSPDLLWPPDRRMVDITATVAATDACGEPAVILVSVLASEPGGAFAGIGASANSIAGADPGTSDFTFQLRAERGGSRQGRIYTVTYAAIDAAGNRSTASATVRVPHDWRRPGRLAPGGFPIP